MPQPAPSTPPTPGGPNRTAHYLGLAVLTLAIVVGLAVLF